MIPLFLVLLFCQKGVSLIIYAEFESKSVSKFDSFSLLECAMETLPHVEAETFVISGSGCIQGKNTTQNDEEKFERQYWRADCQGLARSKYYRGHAARFLTQTNPGHLVCFKDHLVLQHRFFPFFNSFYTGLTNFQEGFGNYYSYFISLRALHRLTQSRNYQAEFTLTNNTGKFTATYTPFKIGNEDSGYELILGEYSGNAGNALAYSNGSKFSTPDHDNDANEAFNCAEEYRSGWWFRDCTTSNINGFNHYRSIDGRSTILCEEAGNTTEYRSPCAQWKPTAWGSGEYLISSYVLLKPMD